MVIQHNMSALFTNNQLGKVSSSQKKSTEKLSSGYRINRAADDAAGLSISEKMRKQIRGLNRGAQNTQDGISFCQVADGALSEVQAMVQRMTELCVQAANGTNSPEDRAAINQEISQIKLEINRTLDATDFNDRPIFQGDPTARKEIPGTSQYVLQGGYVTPSITLTNDNAGTAPQGTGKYHITTDASKDLISVDWTGLDQGVYRATYSLDEFMKNGSFDLKDTTLLDSNGDYQPIPDSQKLPFEIHYDIAALATKEEVADTLNNTYINTGNISVQQLSMNTAAGLTPYHMSFRVNPAYYSFTQKNNDNDTDKGVDFSAYDNAAFTPAVTGGTNLSIGNDTDGSQWQFSFQLEDYGTITAKASYLSASASGIQNGTEGVYWFKDTEGRTFSRSQHANKYSIAGVEDLLTTPGKGLIDAGVSSGTLTLGFTLFDTDGTSSIGSLYMSASYTAGESATAIVDKFKNSLTSSTILTPMNLNPSYSSGVNYYGNGKQIPEYESMLSMKIHTGDKPDDEVEIIYRSLSVAALGLNGMNTLTAEDAKAGLDKVSKALDRLSTERATFGAYQNRLEHTYDSTTNTAENVQAAESRIRDTDIPEEMMHLSTQNILAQAGQSMLGQAMRDKDGILGLLQ